MNPSPFSLACAVAVGMLAPGSALAIERQLQVAARAGFGYSSGTHGGPGAAFDLGIHILVDDVTADSRHLARFDEETGFDTRSVLCVPIVQGYQAFGAIELVNPRSRWQGWHVEAVASVGTTLAGMFADAG